ncbi:MAG TPA: exodeoxyribonuclease VII small subunit [Candidatus Wallbacteria bacterium]|nr:exodeoxyribonuclease VII small subunit [Candidatus Wallbacteria bacterium]
MALRKEHNKEAADKACDLSTLKFEEGLKKLEETLEALENEELPLEESIKKYEQGIQLYNFCRAKLESLEKKIEIISKGTGAEIELKPYERKEIE